MDVRPTHESLLSLAVSAMITSAFLATAPAPIVTAAAGPQPAAILGAVQALKSEGWHGMQAVEIPSAVSVPAPALAPAAHPPIAPAQSLSDDQLKKLLVDTVANGSDAVVKAPIAGPLGIGPAGQAVKVHADAFGGIGTETHAFAAIPAQTGYVLWHRMPDGNRVDYYRLDDKLALVDAVTLTAQGVAHVSPTDAQKTLDAEWTFWRGEIDGGFK